MREGLLEGAAQQQSQLLGTQQGGLRCVTGVFSAPKQKLATAQCDQVAALQILVNPAGLPGDGFIGEHL